PEIRQLRARERELASQIAVLRQGVADEMSRLRARIRDVDSEIRNAEATLARFEQYDRAQRRIAELEAEERRLAQEFEELERQLSLLDRFVQAKTRLLTDKINSRFKLARFQLFRTLVNGGVEECCETTYNGVPYQSLNHGARLNVGLDIINTLAQHYGFAPPVWIDNAESVTDILPTRGQQIRLVVSAGDRTLRVVTNESAIKEA